MENDRFQSSLIKIVKNEDQANRLSVLIKNELRRNPKLEQCSLVSMANAVSTIAQLGLEVGAQGHVYLLPFKEEVQVIVGYKGLIQLAYKAGAIKSIHADVVFENDLFDVTYGSSQNLIHKPTFPRTGSVKCVYAYAKTNNELFIDVMTIDEVNAIESKARSKDIWNNHFNEMAKKTVVRRLFKYLPSMPTEIFNVLEKEDSFDFKKTQTKTEQLIEILEEDENALSK